MRAAFSATLLGLLLLVGCGGDTETPPTLTDVSPSRGSGSGGTAVTLTGTFFETGATVSVGGNPATAVNAVDRRTITCNTPAGTPGATVDVSVTTSGGIATLARGFTYFPAPMLTRVLPTTGFVLGGAALTLTGSGFTANSAGACTVAVGSNAATNVVVAGDASLTCIVPVGTVGPVNVSVSNRNGTGTLFGGFTYYAFPPNFPASDVRLDTDPAGDADSHWGRACCDGSYVYVAWADPRNGNDDLYLNRSLDGGTTWLASDVRIDTDTEGAATSDALHFCCDGATVYVVWHDDRNGARDIYFNRSLDGGVTWLAGDVRIDTGIAGVADSVWPRICCNRSSVYVVWRDGRNGEWDVYFNRSTDGGTTWMNQEVRLDGGNAGEYASVYHRVVCDGANVYVTWYDHRNGNGADVYFNRSTDGGTTWLASDKRLDTDDAGTGHSHRPEVCCDGSNVYVVWHDDRSGNNDIHFNRSLDGGANWLAADLRLDSGVAGSAESGSPLMCCEGQNVYVVWSDGRDGLNDIYFNRSTNSGTSWLASDVRLDRDDAGTHDSVVPAISCCGNNLFVAWGDNRVNNSDIHLNCSRDGGATWLGNDLRLDTDGVGVADSTTVQLCCDGARVYAVWLDDRDDNGDLYFTRSEP